MKDKAIHFGLTFLVSVAAVVVGLKVSSMMNQPSVAAPATKTA